MEYFLIVLVSTPFVAGITIILYKTLTFTFIALMKLIDFFIDIFLRFNWEATCGPLYVQDAQGKIKGMVIYYVDQKEQKYFDLPDGPDGKKILNESLTAKLG